MTLVAGVDDAGRGPVIGPLIIAGVLFHDHEIPRMKSLGVKDSKLLRPNERLRLDEKIKEIAVRYTYVEVTPDEIDRVVLRGKKLNRLNFLEAKAMAEAIKDLSPEIAYVDASDVVEERFGRQIREMLPFEVRIVSEHKADAKYMVVSAASIIAKVRRDQVIARLREEYGDFGSGYSHDPRTRRFLLNWIQRHGGLPDFVRKSWKTIKRLREEATQTRL
ncbi:MAG: ribonuclease HII [Candidatus Bathyarchaeia archaeon]